MTNKRNRTIQRIERANGGEGHLIKELLIEGAQLGSHCRMFAEVTLEGEGIYSDNGVKLSVSRGDVLFCDDGSGHGLVNTDDTSLKFIAVILAAD